MCDLYVCAFLQNPLPAKPWDGVLDATRDSQKCIQRDPYRRDMEIEGSEDCLYLNVYAPHSVCQTFDAIFIEFKIELKICSIP